VFFAEVEHVADAVDIAQHHHGIVRGALHPHHGGVVEDVIEAVGEENRADVLEAVHIALDEAHVRRQPHGELAPVAGEEVIHHRDIVLRIGGELDREVAGHEAGAARNEDAWHAAVNVTGVARR
jgi:hypothetical protein